MIVSHRHKFIFVHLGRTGGRSLTTALAEHCGDSDVITKVRSSCPARNAAGFGRHDSAAAIRAKVGEGVWNDYFKFAFERNPWDKIVSRYWQYAGVGKKKAYKQVWEKAFGKPMTFKQWFWMKVWTGRLLGLGHVRFPAHFRHYTAGGQVIIDFLGRSENSQEHMAWLSDRLKIAIRTDLRIGAENHKARASYTELFDAPMRRVVERVFRRDLALLGYRFGEPSPRDALLFRDGRLIGEYGTVATIGATRAA
jgi:hypothetical protein